MPCKRSVQTSATGGRCTAYYTGPGWATGTRSASRSASVSRSACSSRALLSATRLGRVAAVVLAGGRRRRRRASLIDDWHGGRRRRGRRRRRRGRRRSSSSRARCGVAARAAASRSSSRSSRWRSRASPSCRSSATSRRSPCPALAARLRRAQGRALRGAPLARQGLSRRPAAKLILIVIDGLTPSMFESAVADRRTPTLAFLAEPRPLPPRRLDVSLADARLPVLARDRRPSGRPRDPAPRLVPPRRAARGRVRLVVRRHRRRRHPPLAPGHDLRAQRAATSAASAVTVYEALEDAGLTTAAVNITCYRGRTPHRPTVRMLTRPGLRAEALLLLQPLRVGRDRRPARRAEPRRPGRSTRTPPRSAAGSSPATASTSSSSTSPTTTTPRTRRARTRRTRRSRAATRAIGVAHRGRRRRGRVPRAVRRHPLLRPRPDDVTDVARLQEHLPDELVVASNRAGMVYSEREPRELAARLDGVAAVEVVLFREGAEAVARRDGEELRFAPRRGRLRDDGRRARSSRYPDGLERAGRRSRTRTPASCIVSAAPGWEFADLGGRHHAGGGSPRLARPRRLRGADADGRPRPAAGLDHRRDAARARALRRHAAAATRASLVRA